MCIILASGLSSLARSKTGKYQSFLFSSLNAGSEFEWLLKEFYELYYNFNLAELEKFGAQRKNMNKRFYVLYKKNPHYADAIVLHQLWVIADRIFSTNGVLTVLGNSL